MAYNTRNMDERLYIPIRFHCQKAMNKFGKFTKKVFGNTVGRCLPYMPCEPAYLLYSRCMARCTVEVYSIWFYNGFLIAASNLFEPLYPKIFKALHINNEGRAWKLVRILRTFVLVVISFYFDVCRKPLCSIIYDEKHRLQDLLSRHLPMVHCLN